MTQEQIQQAALDEALVSTDDRVTIVSCNMRIDPIKKQKEATYQVVLDILKLTPCYNAFLITADVPEIYMQQFWFTISKVKDSSLYQFQLDNKKFKNGIELFREILCICPRVTSKEFVAPPPHDSLVTFIKLLGYKGSLEFIFDMYIDMYQPWRTFSSIINKCVSGKTSGLDRLRQLRVQILLKFVGNGEDNQVYGMSIPDVMVNNDIKNTKAYQTYIVISTGVVVPKKARKGMKTIATPKKKEARRVHETHERRVTEKPTSDEGSDESDDEQEGRLTGRRPTGVVIIDTLNVSMKKTLDQSKMLKGIKMLSDVAQLVVDTHKTIKSSKHAYRIQQQPRVSSKGAGITPEVPDEPKCKSKGSSEGAAITPEHDDADKEMNDAENDDEAKDDQEIADVEKVDSEKTEVEKVDNEITGTDQAAKDAQAVALAPLLYVLVLVIPEKTTPTPILTPLPTPPITETHATIVFVPDPSPTVLERLSELEKKVEALSKVDHSTAIEASVQANVINKVKNQLPKLLPKAVSSFDASEIHKIKLKHASKQKGLKHSTTPFDQAAMDKYTQKDLLFKMMMSSKSYNKHPARKDLYDALMQSLLMDEDGMDQGVVEPLTQKKRRHDDEGQDPPSDSEMEKKKRKRKYVEPSKKSFTSKESSKGKTPPKTSEAGKSVTAQESVEELVQEVTMGVEEPIRDDVVNDVDQPRDDADPKKDNSTWFTQPPRPKTHDPEWNKDKNVDDGPEQTWFNDLVNAEKDSLTFDELMATPIDFTKFAMNHLKLDNITKADLVGTVYKLLKGTC
nr:hypothetical protein [Tanacetum cinerariifolium]